MGLPTNNRRWMPKPGVHLPTLCPVHQPADWPAETKYHTMGLNSREAWGEMDHKGNRIDSVGGSTDTPVRSLGMQEMPSLCGAYRTACRPAGCSPTPSMHPPESERSGSTRQLTTASRNGAR